MNFNFSLGELIQILTQVGVGVAIIVALRMKLSQMEDLFARHERHDDERFKELRDDLHDNGF